MIPEAQGPNIRSLMPSFSFRNIINNDELYSVVNVWFYRVETDKKWKTATYRADATTLDNIAVKFYENAHKVF